MNNFIPYGRQDISDEDINEVIKVLRSDWLTQGPSIELFEKGLADYTGAKFSSVACNATAALHLACLAFGISKGDLVWTSPISFVASSNCALYCGATVDFVDIDPRTFNMCPDSLEEKLKLAASRNELPKLIIPVHIAGQSCDMRRISELAKRYDIKVLEDASHAVGGSYLDQKIGSCQYSDATVFSFHPVKIITTAEGGVVLSNDKDLIHKVNLYRTHGITKDKMDFVNNSKGDWYYEQQVLGFNYRLSDIHATLGLSQLKRLNEIISKRNEIAVKYNNAFLDVDKIQTPYIIENTTSSFHLYIINIPEQDKERVFSGLRKKNIGVNLHYYPIHMHPYYKKLGFKEGLFPEAEKYWKKAISIPIFPTISTEDLNYSIASVKELLT